MKEIGGEWTGFVPGCDPDRISVEEVVVHMEGGHRIMPDVAPGDRGNAMGIFQANVGMWQILARQGEIPNSQLNESWQKLIKPFAGIRSAAQVYDAGRASVAELFQFSTGTPKIA